MTISCGLRTLRLCLLCGLVWGLGCDSDSDGGPSGDASIPLDAAGPDSGGAPAPVDAGDGAVEADAGDGAVGPRCEAKHARFDVFVADHRSCVEDADCTVIGDCGPNADFVAVQTAVSSEAYDLMRARCSGAFDGPVFNARCQAAVCVLEQRTDTCCGCGLEDGGTDADGGS